MGIAVLLARCVVMCVAVAVLECGLAVSDAGLARVIELGARIDKESNGQASIRRSWFACCHMSNPWSGDNPTQTTRPSQGQGRYKGTDDKTCLDSMATVHGDDVPMNMYNPGHVYWIRAIAPSITSIMSRRSMSHDAGLCPRAVTLVAVAVRERGLAFSVAGLDHVAGLGARVAKQFKGLHRIRRS